MMDIVEERGMEIDLHRLPELLGDIPVVPVSARKRSGLDVLLHAVVHHYEEKHRPEIITYQKEIEEKIRLLEQELEQQYHISENSRWYALKLLEQDQEITELYPLDLPKALDRSYEKDIINQKYDYIEEALEDTLFYKSEKAAFTDRVDEILTHPIWGMPIFFGIMAVVFFLTFFVGDGLKGGFEVVLETISSGVLHMLERMHVAEWMISLVVDGILAGVGGILTFLPNICCFRGQRLYGKGGLCDGWTDGTSGLVRQGVSAYGSWIWLYGTCHYGSKDIGKRIRPKAHHTDYAVYVLFRKASHLCAVCRYVF